MSKCSSTTIFTWSKSVTNRARQQTRLLSILIIQHFCRQQSIYPDPLYFAKQTVTLGKSLQKGNLWLGLKINAQSTDLQLGVQSRISKPTARTHHNLVISTFQTCQTDFCKLLSCWQSQFASWPCIVWLDSQTQES